jgi:uncharacterized protein with PIN domain
MRRMSGELRPKFPKTKLDRCLACEKQLSPEYIKHIFGPLSIQVAWLCRHCHTIYGLDDEILELGKFGSTHIGIS